MMFRRTLIGAAVVSIISLVVAGTAGAASRVALVIGNTNYENLNSLINPGNDARRLARVLQTHGFDVMSCDGAEPGCFDLGRSELRDALEDFEDETDGADVALLFYAGHGLQTAEGNVLAPVDMQIACDDWKAKREVLLDDVLKAMSGAREKIVILDACRNDPFKAQQCLSRGARPLSFGTFAVPDSVSRFLLITSTLNGQVALDGEPGTNSPFAEALFYWMEQEPRIQFDQMFGRVAKRVIEQTTAANFTQVPEILIRGGTPEACLDKDGCGVDPQAEVLRREIAQLTEENLRSQELAEIGAAYLRATGIEEGKQLSEEERNRILREIGGASRALADRQDAEGERALAALKEGNESEAEKLFEDVITASVREAEDAALAAAERRADANRKAAQAARHIAALARPKDVAKAAKYFQRATEFDPDHYQTWMDLASTSVDIGNTSQALRAYRKASALARDAGSLSDRFWAANGQGDIVQAQGRLERALSFFEAAKNIAEEMVANNPEDLNVKRNIQVSLNRIGDVLIAMGDLNGALAAFTEGREIAQKLVATNPDFLGWNRDLSVSEERLGNVLKAQGDFDGALAYHQATYERMKRFADADPDDKDLTRFVMVTLNKIGDIRLVKSDVDGAFEAYTEAMDMARSLIEYDPGHAGWQRDMAISNERVGDIYAEREQYDEAMYHYRESFNRVLPLIEADPDNADLKRIKQIRLNKIGDVQIEQGKVEDALETFIEGQKIIEALIEGDPLNAEWKSDLTISYERVADTYVALKRPDEALEVYKKNLEISRQLAASDPSNVNRQWGLYVALWRIADNTDEKVAYFEEALALLERLYAEGKLAPYRHEWIETTRQRLENARAGKVSAKGGDDERIGEDLKAAGDFAGAKKRLLASIEQVDAQIADIPDDLDLQRARQVRLIKLGDVQVELKETEAALKTFLECQEIMERLTAVDPNNNLWLSDLTISYERVADTYVSLGRRDEALVIYEKNLEISKKVAATEPDNVDRQWGLYVAMWRIADNTSESVKYFGEALAVLEKLHAQGKLSAARIPWIEKTRKRLEEAQSGMRDVAGTVDADIGDDLKSADDFSGAKEHFLASLAQLEPLLEADPDNLDLQRVRQVRLIKLGDVQVELGETEAALETFLECQQIMEKLTAVKSDNTLWLADLSVSYERVADTYVALDRRDEALAIYEKNLEMSKKLADANPDDTDRQWGLYVAMWRIADNTDESVKYFGEALALLEKLNAEKRLGADRVKWIKTTRNRLKEAKLAAKE